MRELFWLDGLFTDGLCTAATSVIFLQFVPVIGSRELEGKAAKRGVGFGDDQ
jgi:hypothetical protein